VCRAVLSCVVLFGLRRVHSGTYVAIVWALFGGRPWPRAICFCECLSGRQGSWPCRAVTTQACKVTAMDSTTQSAAPGWDVVVVTSVLAVAVGRRQSRHCGVRTGNRTLAKRTLEPL